MFPRYLVPTTRRINLPEYICIFHTLSLSVSESEGFRTHRFSGKLDDESEVRLVTDLVSKAGNEQRKLSRCFHQVVLYLHISLRPKYKHTIYRGSLKEFEQLGVKEGEIFFFCHHVRNVKQYSIFNLSYILVDCVTLTS